jgi:hypothetical protein
MISMTKAEQGLSDPEGDEEESLSELGDYWIQLTDYEERLARGEIQWQ